MSYATRALAVASALLMGAPTAFADTISGTDFEGGSLSGWNVGSQPGNLTNGTITGSGTGVTLINGSVTFNAPSHGAVGSPTLQDGSPNQYHAPATSPTTWTFSPYGTYGAALQPTGSTTFDAATSALGLTSAENQAIKTKLQQDQQASGLGNPNPTNAAWLTQNVTLNAGTTYTMSWNYIGTDYVPFNDGSITSLVYQGTGSTPVVTVNNYVQNYALLGFTNPGTGDYSTGTYGSTGWQNSTYQVDVTGAYLLGFAVFNLGDTALSPVLLVDSQPGTTLANGQSFGAVAPNNPNAPTVNPTPPTPPTPPSAPTVTGTSTTDQVSTSSSTSNVVVTAQVTYNVSNLDSNGYGTVENYTDTVETTTPVTTTTTTTTPVTTTTYSDGSTTTSNGTSVVTSSTSNGTSTSQVTGTVLNYTSTISPSISSAIAASQTLPAVTTKAYNYGATENNGKQKISKETVTTVITPMVTTTTTTPVTTTVYADGSTSITNGNPSYTYTSSESVAVSNSYDYYFGRVDQLEVLDGINDGINGLLNHEPTRTKQKLRVFENNRFVQSYNADGYKADSNIFGGGFELDITKGWTVGFQYNQVNIKLRGVDSSTHQIKDHFGIFNTLHGNTFTLNTNAAIANSKYNYNRNVEDVFNNAGETTGTEWWVSNRLYVHLSKNIKPFIGHTVQNVKRNAYTETGSSESARSVKAFNQTTHVGEAGIKLETRFGGKKKDLFGVSVDGAYGTDSSYGVTASVDYKEMLIIEGSHGVNNGVTNNSIAGKVKFRF
jgi:hypothetical protein